VAAGDTSHRLADISGRMTRLLAAFAVTACSSAAIPGTVASSTAAPSSNAAAGPAVAAAADELCCCERTFPGPLSEPHAARTTERWESRRDACTHDTPEYPAGRCADWTGCGFPNGSHRTLADRPDLAPPVALPAGSCCCEGSDGRGFQVVDTAACRSAGACLEPEWCAGPAQPRRPPSTPVLGDRCVQIADHFEPWRKNPDWAAEISPRERLVADCKAQHWSAALEDCLLAANGPLDLDGCVGL
jgi:hypothetical protein